MRPSARPGYPGWRRQCTAVNKLQCVPIWASILRRRPGTPLPFTGVPTACRMYVCIAAKLLAHLRGPSITEKKQMPLGPADAQVVHHWGDDSSFMPFAGQGKKKERRALTKHSQGKISPGLSPSPHTTVLQPDLSASWRDSNPVQGCPGLLQRSNQQQAPQEGATLDGAGPGWVVKLQRWGHGKAATHRAWSLGPRFANPPGPSANPFPEILTMSTSPSPGRPSNSSLVLALFDKFP
jgi:hypothetical protein